MLSRARTSLSNIYVINRMAIVSHKKKVFNLLMVVTFPQSNARQKRLRPT